MPMLLPYRPVYHGLVVDCHIFVPSILLSYSTGTYPLPSLPSIFVLLKEGALYCFLSLEHEDGRR